jgi:hypothetical protein
MLQATNNENIWHKRHMQFKFDKELPKGLFENSKGILHNRMSPLMPCVVQ